MRKTVLGLSAVFLTLLVVACGSENGAERTLDKAPSSGQTAKAEPPTPSVSVKPYTLVAKLPHDTMAFTQGLTVHNGVMYESTGQYGQSDIRKVDVMSGRVLSKQPLGDTYFGEGMAVVGDKAFVLTWMNQEVLIYDPTTLERTGSYRYVGEGWGLTTDGNVLYMSNGTNVIAVRDGNDFHIVRSLSVTRDGRPQGRLNELEWINGEIWANVWQSEQIVRIDPETGVVTGVVDCTGIFPYSERAASADVLNGIAYDEATGNIYVTGKNWPWLYHIEVK